MLNKLQFSANLRREMDKRGLLQKQVAKAVGVRPVAVCKWLKGTLPDIPASIRLARFFGVTVEDLMKGVIL